MNIYWEDSFHTTCSDSGPDSCSRQKEQWQLVWKSCQGVKPPKGQEGPRKQESWELILQWVAWRRHGATVQDKAGCYQTLFPSTVTVRSLKLATQLGGWRHSQHRPANRSWILRTQIKLEVVFWPPQVFCGTCAHICTSLIYICVDIRVHYSFTQTHKHHSYTFHSYIHILHIYIPFIHKHH